MIYDVIIIGAGSAGLPAGMYAARYRMNTVVIGSLPGGALSTSHKVENYPGILSAPGAQIMQQFSEHAVASGAQVRQETVKQVTGTYPDFCVELSTGEELHAKTIIVATGNTYRKLNAPGEKEFLGRGVSYCATGDGMFFRGKTVAIVGGGNTAITEALYLADICEKVYVLVRSKIRAEDVWVDQLKKRQNVEIMLGEQVAQIQGKMLVEKLLLESGKEILVSGIFVAVGSDPDTSVVDGYNLQKDEEGCLVITSAQETSQKGIFAAGDVTTGSHKFKQTIMSAAEGSLAAHSAHELLLREA